MHVRDAGRWEPFEGWKKQNDYDVCSSVSSVSVSKAWVQGFLPLGLGCLPLFMFLEEKRETTTLNSEECQKPQPPLLLKKVSQYTSHLYCNTPPICTAVLLVPLRSEEREILSVLLPFVSQYASHLYYNTPPICIAVLLGKSWWLWSPECSPSTAGRMIA